MPTPAHPLLLYICGKIVNLAIFHGQCGGLKKKEMKGTSILDLCDATPWLLLVPRRRLVF